MTEPGHSSIWSEVGAAVAGFVSAAAGWFGWTRVRGQRAHRCHFDAHAIAEASRENTDRIIEANRVEGEKMRKALYEGFYSLSEKQGALALEVAVVKDRLRVAGKG